MYLSQIVEMGTKEQVFGNPQHPYSKALLSSVLFTDPTDRRIDREVRESLAGEIPSPINLPVGCYLYGRCPLAVEACQTMPQRLEPLSDGRLVRCWRVTRGDVPLEGLTAVEVLETDADGHDAPPQQPCHENGGNHGPIAETDPSQ
jgi:oligopeptide/dipeptide ABC transporter ATP-binding protein